MPPQWDLRLFSVARSRGEILRWPVRLLSLQSALMVFANCSSIALASVKAIGPAIIQGHCPLINFRLTKFLATSGAAAAALSALSGIKRTLLYGGIIQRTFGSDEPVTCRCRCALWTCRMKIVLGRHRHGRPWSISTTPRPGCPWF
jgi:hypothetical protein